MAPQWEIVGGADKGGIMVREGQDMKSAEAAERLSTGAVVEELELIAGRLHYRLVTGTGPKEGWISTKLKDKDLALPTGSANTSARQPAIPPPDQDELKRLGPITPQFEQTPGKPYVHDHRIQFPDTKPSGLRMSALLGMMDELRTDLFSICDMSVTKFQKVSDPFTDVAIEMHPNSIGLSTEDGLLYTAPKSDGVVLSWVTGEAEFGWWGELPMRTEEQTHYFIGKNRKSKRRVPLCTARFVEAFVDDDKGGLLGTEFQEDANKFWARLKKDHSAERLNKRPTEDFYPKSGKPFAPTVFKSVTWTMSFTYGDVWSILYHARTPELIWELNQLAGGPFKALVKDEPDPQAMAINLPTKMSVGTTYEAVCFLEEATSKAAYILYPQGSDKLQDVCLVVFARYNWADTTDGKTLTWEDVALVGKGRVQLYRFATTKTAKASQLLDTTGCKE